MSFEVKHPRVAFVLAELDPLRGMERSAVGLLEALQDRFAVDVYCLGGQVSREVNLSNLRVLGRSLRGPRRLVLGALRFRKVDWARYDKVVVVGTWAAIPFLVQGRVRVPIIVWEHSLAAGSVQASFGKWVMHRLRSRLYRRTQAVVAVSKPLAEYISMSVGPGPRVQEIPNLHLTEAYRDARSIERPYRLLMVGTLNQNKNASEAFKALAKAGSNVTLTVVGDGPERKALEKQARRLQITDRVHFRGSLSSGAVQIEMRSHDALVHTSFAETFGYVYLEAADAGLPVISREHAVACWMIDRYVPGVIYGTGSNALAECLQGVLKPTLDPFAAWKARREAFGLTEVVREWETLLLRELP